jgi:hypothetical protein
MAAIFAAVAFVGFAPSYWVPMVSGSLNVAPLFHIHGAIFFAWTLFLLLQTSLVAGGRTIRHRELGMAGIALATAMVLVGLAVAVRSMNDGVALGVGHARAFSLVSLSGIAFFAVAFGYAVANVTRPEVHKRAMMLASVSLLQPAVGRWFALFVAPPGAIGPPPVPASVAPGLVSDLLLIALVVHDWRTRGRVHRVYVLGGIVLVALQLLRVPLSATPAWLAMADWIAGLAR